MTTQEAKPSIAEISLDAQLMANAFLKLKDGETLTYDDLTKLIGRNARERRGQIQTAINRCQNDHGVAIACVRGVGYRRIVGAAVVASAAEAVPKIHRVARRGTKRLGCVGDLTKLPQAELTKLNAVASHLGAIQLATTNRAAKKIETAVSQTQEKLAVAKTLELFK